jgi:hypothetical protein
LKEAIMVGTAFFNIEAADGTKVSEPSAEAVLEYLKTARMSTTGRNALVKLISLVSDPKELSKDIIDEVRVISRLSRFACPSASAFAEPIPTYSK